jgi:hypothetical protein
MKMVLSPVQLQLRIQFRTRIRLNSSAALSGNPASFVFSSDKESQREVLRRIASDRPTFAHPRVYV